MILRRLGNKKKIAKKIQRYFPEHKIYIEPFFGAGGMFFNKPKVKYNIVNDLDSDVFNLFQVVMNQKEKLEKVFYMMPIHSDLLKYWKVNKEMDPIKKAIRFLFFSNFLLFGNNGSIKWSARNEKGLFFLNIDKTFDLLYGIRFNHTNAKKFLNDLQLNGTDIDPVKTFIYNDPPYINTKGNYENKDWNKQDFIDLLDCNIKTKCKFAVSEFDNEFVIKEAKKRNLNIITIGERKNIKNRRIEILITNYKKQVTFFD